MLTLDQVKEEVSSRAHLIGAHSYDLPTFGITEGSGRPHVEVGLDSYHFVVSERGIEYERISSKDIDVILYRIFQSVTFEIAVRFELAHRVSGDDCRRLLWSKQLELLQTLSANWRDERKTQIEAILLEHPFRDEPEG